MIDWSSLPPGTPIWATGTVGVLMLILTFWERLAKIKGPLGTLARWWNGRQLREVERRTTLNSRIETLVADRVASETKGLRDSLESLKLQVADLQQAREVDKALIAKLETSRNQWAGFAGELTTILYRVRQIFNEHGWEFPEKVPTFHEYRARNKNPP